MRLSFVLCISVFMIVGDKILLLKMDVTLKCIEYQSAKKNSRGCPKINSNILMNNGTIHYYGNNENTLISCKEQAQLL